jgi:FAD/FMN-containing dehydrogenase
LKLDEATLAAYAGDKWHATGLPDAVALPRSVKSVSAIMRFANRYQIPVTPRGTGFGYVGGCVPLKGGIALSTARMKRIKEINENDFVAIAQPGVITLICKLRPRQRACIIRPIPRAVPIAASVATLPPTPAARAAFKYGVTSDYVLGLEVVLSGGTVACVGGRTHKNKTGFDFPRFFTGSEGMLAVITEATLKLLPLPPFRSALSVGFGSVRLTIRGIKAIFKAGFLPSALELADEFT